MRTDHSWTEVFTAMMNDTDIVLEVLDARNPLGTLNATIEEFIHTHHSSIILILLLNKVDIIPEDVQAKWTAYFRTRGYKIIPISARYNSGLHYLMQTIHQLAVRTPTNILIVGYPNTGKSSVIEALTKHQKKVGVSSNAGFTRGIKKIKLSQNLFLIDTPGVIPMDETNETEQAMKSFIISEKIDDPLAVIEAIFKLLPKSEFERIYKISLDQTDGPEELIEKLGKKLGRLIAKGQVNTLEVAKHIIRDWQANKLKYYLLPPESGVGPHSSEIKPTTESLNRERKEKE